MILQNHTDIGMELKGQVPSGYIEAVVEHQIKNLLEAMLGEIKPDKLYVIKLHTEDYEDMGRYVFGYKSYINFNELVRCRECQNYRAESNWCVRQGEHTTADDFCSRAERVGGMRYE